MIYISINQELNRLRDTHSYTSRTEFFRTLFTIARQKAEETNDEAMITGYFYKKDLLFIDKTITKISKEITQKGKSYFCRFIVSKDTVIQ